MPITARREATRGSCMRTKRPHWPFFHAGVVDDEWCVIMLQSYLDLVQFTNPKIGSPPFQPSDFSHFFHPRKVCVCTFCTQCVDLHWYLLFSASADKERADVPCKQGRAALRRGVLLARSGCMRGGAARTPFARVFCKCVVCRLWARAWAWIGRLCPGHQSTGRIKVKRCVIDDSDGFA